MSILSLQGSPYISDDDLAAFARQAVASRNVEGKRALCIVPDTTRSMPMAAMFRALCAAFRQNGARVDFLVALGTHPPMSEADLLAWFGITAQARGEEYADVGLFNHEWKNEDALTCLGHWTADRLAELSEGLMTQSVDIHINRRIFDYDLLCVAGPVFPHEVVGFSGGNKYFFPGIAGPEILDMFHWLAALVTNPQINGTKHTPVRRVIDEAAAMIPLERAAFCLNVSEDRCRSIYFGSPEEAWSPAADAAMETHIVTMDRPYESVLAMCPPKYYDLWVAGKCMYKLEPIVADGGELIIYAPHVSEVSRSHGPIIERIGYHTRDYFLAQMDRFADVPGGILAHSTHVRGIGTYEDGAEKPRIDVTLATGISAETCARINLGYRNPDSIDPADWAGRASEGRLLVRNAGEVLHRLRHGNPAPESPVAAL